MIFGFYPMIPTTALRNDGRLTLYVTSLPSCSTPCGCGDRADGAGARATGVGRIRNGVDRDPDAERLIRLPLTGLLTTTIVYRIQRLSDVGSDCTGLPNRLWLLQQTPRIFDGARTTGNSLTLSRCSTSTASAARRSARETAIARCGRLS